MTGRIVQLIAALFAVAACVPGTAAPRRADPAGTFDTRTAPRFGDPRPGLRTYLSSETPSPRGAQHLCVIGYGTPRGDAAQVWVHWREGGRLISWDGSDPGHRASRLGWGRRDLDRRELAAATPEEIAASTYLVAPAAFDRTVADCARRGARYTMTAPTRAARRR